MIKNTLLIHHSQISGGNWNYWFKRIYINKLRVTRIYYLHYLENWVEMHLQLHLPIQAQYLCKIAIFLLNRSDELLGIFVVSIYINFNLPTKSKLGYTWKSAAANSTCMKQDDSYINEIYTVNNIKNTIKNRDIRKHMIMRVIVYSKL